MNTKEAYRKTEKWLYNLGALKQRICNLEARYKEVEMNLGCSGLDYSKDKLSQSYAFNSETENKAGELLDIKINIEIQKNKVKMIEESLNMLNPSERKIVELKYFDNEPWFNIAYKVQYSERQSRNIRTNAINKLSLALFGESDEIAV